MAKGHYRGSFHLIFLFFFCRGKTGKEPEASINSILLSEPPLPRGNQEIQDNDIFDDRYWPFQHVLYVYVSISFTSNWSGVFVWFSDTRICSAYECVTAAPQSTSTFLLLIAEQHLSVARVFFAEIICDLDYIKCCFCCLPPFHLPLLHIC